jgi:hypothetical protein
MAISSFTQDSYHRSVLSESAGGRYHAFTPS